MAPAGMGFALATCGAQTFLGTFVIPESGEEQIGRLWLAPFWDGNWTDLVLLFGPNFIAAEDSRGNMSTMRRLRRPYFFRNRSAFPQLF